MMKKKIFLIIVAILYSLLYLYSGITKLAERGDFEAQLQLIKILSSFSFVLSWLLPLLEIALSIGLLIPFLRIRAVLYSVLLMTVFTVYLLLLHSEPGPACGCGGFIENLTPVYHLLFNFGFIGLGLYALILNNCMQFPLAGGNRRSRKAV
jgi:uncharacterized membrane protein YphA (DoxX/SURF4 family)